MSLTLRTTLLATALTLALGACATQPRTASKAVALTGIDALPLTRGIDPANFDPTVAPCTDFFRHANGGWLQRNPIPDDQSSWGSFGILQERNVYQLRALMERAERGEIDSDSDTARASARMVGDFYASALDEERIDALGAQPLQPLLDEIAAITDHAGLWRYLASTHRQGRSALFGVGVAPDFLEPTMNYLYLSQGGLGMPDRDDYLGSDQRSQEQLQAYRNTIAELMQLAGHSPEQAELLSQRVLELETRLAEASLTRVQRRDPKTQYAPISVADLVQLTPNLDWPVYFEHLGLTGVEQLSVGSRDFFLTINTLWADLPIGHWQDYLRWHLVRSAAPHLSRAFVDAEFNFYQGRLRGQQSQREHWKRVVAQTSASLGEPVGALYVAEHFPPQTKALALDMIGDLKAALKLRLQALDWMGEETRIEALRKFASFTAKIGYPDQWRDYTGLNIVRGDHFGNLRRIAAFDQARQLARFGQPVDRSEWRISPQIVNAYYSPLQNEIVFPAAILQPPFFDPQIDPAVNYGAMGAVIGHELLHGFDDRGSQYDADGRLRNWWTEQDRERFTARTNELVKQYSAYRIEGAEVNGQLTLGENIADLGGLTVAYDALQARLQRAPVGPIDGLSQEQRFFLSWAQVWRRNMRPQALALMVRTDSHSPAPFRTNGPVKNMPSFSAAYDCQPDDPMVRDGESRIAIW